MADQIISIAHTKAKARADHTAGRGRDDHNMNWHAAAVQVYHAEWDRCEAAKRRAGQQLEAACPP